MAAMLTTAGLQRGFVLREGEGGGRGAEIYLSNYSKH